MSLWSVWREVSHLCRLFSQPKFIIPTSTATAASALTSCGPSGLQHWLCQKVKGRCVHQVLMLWVPVSCPSLSQQCFYPRTPESKFRLRGSSLGPSPWSQPRRGVRSGAFPTPTVSTWICCFRVLQPDCCVGAKENIDPIYTFDLKVRKANITLPPPFSHLFIYATWIVNQPWVKKTQGLCSAWGWRNQSKLGLRNADIPSQLR